MGEGLSFSKGLNTLLHGGVGGGCGVFGSGTDVAELGNLLWTCTILTAVQAVSVGKMEQSCQATG